MLISALQYIIEDTDTFMCEASLTRKAFNPLGELTKRIERIIRDSPMLIYLIWMSRVYSRERITVKGIAVLCEYQPLWVGSFSISLYLLQTRVSYTVPCTGILSRRTEVLPHLFTVNQRFK